MAYTPPGVTVTELTSPTTNPQINEASVVAVVGLSAGYVRRTDRVTLTGTTAVALPGLPAGATLISDDSNVVVKDTFDDPTTVPSGYNATTGYSTAEFTLDPTGKTLARVSSGGGGGGGASLIPSGQTVYVTYDYAPAGYYTAQKFTDLAEIEALYGPALSADLTTIVSPLTFGCLNAFEGGAREVYAVPLFKRTTPSDPDSVRVQPSSSQAADPTTWQQTLYALRDVEEINLFVPAIGQSFANVDDTVQLNVFLEFHKHLNYLRSIQQYGFLVLGEDSSTDSTKATKATIRSHASTLRSNFGGVLAEQTALVNTAKFPRPSINSAGTVYVGGQWVAAKIAGMLAGFPVSQALTRQVVPGLTGVADPRSRQDKIDDGAAGLIVLDEKNGAVIIRHSISIDTSSSAHRQVAVVRSKQRVIESVRDTLETQVIGKTVPSRLAAAFVSSSVQAVLETLKGDNVIEDYSSINARLLAGDPTVVEVRFDYKPLFSIDYISIKFSLDLSTQVATVA